MITEAVKGRHIIFLMICLETNIRITCPCDLYPLTPHFYVVKLGFTGVYIFFILL